MRDSSSEGAAVSPSAPGAYGKYRLRLLAAVGLFWMGLYLYVPVLSPYVVHVTGSLGIAGLVVASYGVPQLLTRLALALWSDRTGRRTVFLRGGTGLVVLSGAGLALAHSGPAFMALRVLAGLAASTWAMFSIQYASYLGHDHVSQAMGWVSLANNAGQVVAVLLGGIVVEHFAMAGAFWASALIGAAALALVWNLPDEPRQHSGRPSLALGALLRQGDVWTASALGIVYQAVTFVTVFGYIPVWGAEQGLSSVQLGLLTAAALVPGAVMTVVAGSWLTPRWGLQRVVPVAFCLVAAGTGATPWLGAGWALYAAQAVAGLGRGMLAPTLMTWSVARVRPKERTTALALYQSLYAGGMIAGPAAAAAVVARVGVADLLVGAGVLAMAGAAASLLVAGRSAVRASAAARQSAT